MLTEYDVFITKTRKIINDMDFNFEAEENQKMDEEKRALI